MRYTGDRDTGRLLGLQLFGHLHAEIAKRIDIAATAIFHSMTVDAMSDLDLSYTPPLGARGTPSRPAPSSGFGRLATDGDVAGMLAPSDRTRVLVVEDDPSYREALSVALGHEGFAVMTTGTATEGLALYVADPPDIVLLDVLLPDGSGIDLCRRMAELAPIPVMLVSVLKPKRWKSSSVLISGPPTT